MRPDNLVACETEHIEQAATPQDCSAERNIGGIREDGSKLYEYRAGERLRGGGLNRGYDAEEPLCMGVVLA